VTTARAATTGSGDRPRVVFLNPPGPRGLYRGVECTYFVKGGYQIHPLHFVALSGVLGSSRHDFTHIDALMASADEETTLARLADARPDLVVAAVSSLHFDGDRAFLSRVARRMPHVPVVTVGEVLHDPRFRDFDLWPGVAGHLLDYVDNDLARFVRGGGSESPGLLLRGRAPVERTRGARFEIEPPAHELFDHPRFRMPFLRRRRYATVLTTYGCPYSCHYCPLPNLDFKYRPAANVAAELAMLAARGIDELAVYDPTFGVPREVALETLALLESHRFGWWCQTRLDVLDDDMAVRMRRAGCHTASIGIESHDGTLLTSLGKPMALDVKERVRAIRRSGIRVCGNFVLGLPGQDRDACEETVRFALDLDLDFATFNLASPFTGTPLRESLVREGRIGPTELGYDNARKVLAIGDVPVSELEAIRDRAFRRFFLRPGAIVRRVAGLRTIDELRLLAGPALDLLSGVSVVAA
jgi:hypothetical protein